MQHLIRLFITTGILLIAFSVPCLAHGRAHEDHEGPSAFQEIIEHYDAVRLALLADSTDGIAGHAQAIAHTAEHLEESFSAAAATVADGNTNDARALLPEIVTAASNLNSAGDLNASRDAFYELSKPLVRWRNLATGDRPIVVYCPMKKRSWLQTDEAIGNPYYGQAMASCGEVVDGD